MPASDLRRDEDGATLILAVIFMTVVALLAVVLGRLAVNNLLDTTALQSTRSTEYAAEAATEVAVQAVRYTNNSYQTAAFCTPNASPISVNSATIKVYCTGTSNPTATRTVTFWACLNATSGNCTAPILQANITFYDYSPAGIYACSASTQATCGAGMTVNSWVVYSAGNSTAVASANASVSVATTSLPGATFGAGYSATLTSGGGTSPFTWSATGLPSGLSVAGGSGVITGTVAGTAGSYSVTATVQDSLGATSSAPLTLVVNSAPRVVTTSLPAATLGQAYSQTVTATGGTTPLTWSVSGSLPGGLTVTPGSGVISGTVTGTAVGYAFTAIATDANGATASAPLSITVNPVLTLSATPLPAATLGQTYSQAVTATGGTSPITWSSTGPLPTGLSLAPGSGVISGTVTGTAGTYPFTVTATDVNGATAAASLSITVNNTLTITTTSLPAATSGMAYSQTLTATGGKPPVTWSELGALPGGLSLTAGSGQITGTVTGGGGPYSFTAVAADANGVTATATLSITVQVPPTFTAASPPVTATVNTSYSYSFAASGTAPVTFALGSGNLPVGLTLSSSGLLSGTPTANGSSTFTVSASNGYGTAATTASITITVGAPPAFTADSPTATATAGTPYNYTFTASGSPAPVFSLYGTGSLPAGLTWSPSTGQLSGTPTTAGIYTFALSASNGFGSLATTPSITITVGPGPASQLAYTTQPTVNQNITAGAATALRVSVEDSYGNVEASDNATTVTLALGSNGASALSCTNTGGTGPVTVVSGVATFSCSLNKAGTGYTLTATSSPAHGTATTNAFNIVPAAASKLVFTSTVSGNQTAAVTATVGPFMVQEQDAYSNPVAVGTTTTVSVTTTSTGAPGHAPFFTTTSGGVTSSAITITPGSSSTPSFFYSDTKADTPTATVSSGSLAAGATTVTIVGGAASTTLTLSSCAVNSASTPCATTFSGLGTAGVLTAYVSVADSYGNPVAATSLVALTGANGNTTNWTLAGTPTTILNGAAQSAGQIMVTHKGNGNNSATITISATGFTNLVFTVSD